MTQRMTQQIISKYSNYKTGLNPIGIFRSDLNYTNTHSLHFSNILKMIRYREVELKYEKYKKYVYEKYNIRL